MRSRAKDKGTTYSYSLKAETERVQSEKLGSNRNDPKTVAAYKRFKQPSWYQKLLNKVGKEKHDENIDN